MLWEVTAVSQVPIWLRPFFLGDVESFGTHKLQDCSFSFRGDALDARMGTVLNLEGAGPQVSGLRHQHLSLRPAPRSRPLSRPRPAHPRFQGPHHPAHNSLPAPPCPAPSISRAPPPTQRAPPLWAASSALPPRLRQAPGFPVPPPRQRAGAGARAVTSMCARRFSRTSRTRFCGHGAWGW